MEWGNVFCGIWFLTSGGTKTNRPHPPDQRAARQSNCLILHQFSCFPDKSCFQSSEQTGKRHHSIRSKPTGIGSMNRPRLVFESWESHVDHGSNARQHSLTHIAIGQTQNASRRWCRSGTECSLQTRGQRLSAGSGIRHTSAAHWQTAKRKGWKPQNVKHPPPMNISH
jgi:hypothetical protein